MIKIIKERNSSLDKIYKVLLSGMRKFTDDECRDNMELGVFIDRTRVSHFILVNTSWNVNDTYMDELDSKLSNLYDYTKTNIDKMVLLEKEIEKQESIYSFIIAFKPPLYNINHIMINTNWNNKCKDDLCSIYDGAKNSCLDKTELIKYALSNLDLANMDEMCLYSFMLAMQPIMNPMFIMSETWENILRMKMPTIFTRNK